MPVCPRCQSREIQREHTAYGDWSRCLKCRILYAPIPENHMPAQPSPTNALKGLTATTNETGRFFSWRAPAPGIYRFTGSVTALFGLLFVGGGVFLSHWSYAWVGLLFGGLMLWIGLDQLRKGFNTHQIHVSNTGSLRVETGPWPHWGYPCERETGQALFCRAFKQAQVALFYLYAHHNGQDIKLTPAELESQEQAFWLLYHCQSGVQP